MRQVLTNARECTVDVVRAVEALSADAGTTSLIDLAGYACWLHAGVALIAAADAIRQITSTGLTSLRSP
jgi:hypothetical protein